MKRIWIRAALAACTLALALQAAAIDITVLPNEELQQRYEALTHEFRCMQCQNNSIADSPVSLASDLRASMVQRYGNVILFRPPMSGGTLWIWIAPLLVLLGGVWVAVRIVRRRGALVASDDSDVPPEDGAR